MRTSFTHIATALLGLGSVFSSVIAAPTGFGGEINSNELEARATKKVPDIKAAPYSYEVEARAGLGGKESFYVKRKGIKATYLNFITVDRKTATVTVEDANNDQDLKDNRIPLRDIAMYIYTNKDPKQGPLTMKKISFAPVVEAKSVAPAIKAAQKELGKTAFKVTPTSTGKEKKVFDDFMKTIFGRSVAHYKADYGLDVAAIEIVGGGENFNMDFHMQRATGTKPTKA